VTAPRPLLGARTAFLRPFVDAGVLGHAEVHVADAIARAVPGTADDVLLAATLAVRATRLSHVCVVLADVPGALVLEDDADRDRSDGRVSLGEGSGLAGLPWPPVGEWAAALRGSAAVALVDGEGRVDSGVVDGTVRPLVFDGARVYLERYWRFERLVGDDLLARAGADRAVPAGGRGLAGLNPGARALAEPVLDQLFGAVGATGAAPDLQRQAAEAALARQLVVIAGGPGTGKTRTVARLLAATHQVAQGGSRPLQVALAAPTGKAAARMTEAVHLEVSAAGLDAEHAEALLATEASTIHRLLGGRGSSFRHHRDNPLAADVVVVDEASMISLPLMARLLDAVRPDARLVLVGDPYQLSSIEAGAVLGDVVGGAPAGASGPMADSVVVLQRVHRFGADSTIAALAAAVRDDDADRAVALLRAGRPDVEWVLPDDHARFRAVQREVVDNAVAVVRAALDGDGVSGLARGADVKVLAATRQGPLGTDAWSDRIEALVGRAEPRLRAGGRWYVGRPVIVTRNDPTNGLVNGDTGLVVATATADAMAVVFPDVDPEPGGTRAFQPSQLSDVETWWAMTIHKSQGSEYRHAVVSLPAAGSPILTRELLYTAVTRARERVTVVASEAALRAAIARPVARASGLQPRLWPAEPG